MKADTYIVFSCDQNYFPLAKGLVLSLTENMSLPRGIRLAFLDIGCSADALAWLRERDVLIRALDVHIMGPLAHERLGYRRSQVARPFLPKLFPDAEVLVWIDCDAWVQDLAVLPLLRDIAARNTDKVVVAPEHHYSYTPINDDPVARRGEMYSYYEPTFGHEIASRLSGRPTLNSGFFAMERTNALWSEWQCEIERLFADDSGRYPSAVLHMAEQVALNVVASRGARVILLDPLYNYICLWTLPFRDGDGIVRVGLPPHLPIGIVHLAGGWRFFGEKYFREKLLYRSGEYLSDADRAILFQSPHTIAYR